MTEIRPLPKHYLWFAEEVNRSSAFLLRPVNENLNSTSLSISIGLSLHAIELCAKSMLRSLGFLMGEIRERHKTHRILELLGDVESQILAHSDPGVRRFQSFLLHSPVIDGQEFNDTIASYLKKHFNQGKTAFPRSYLYPDNETFIGPQPFAAINVMAEYLIDTGKQFAVALGHESS